LFDLLLICCFPCTANMPITSHFVVSSISYCHCYVSSLPAIGRCFTSWCSTASSFVPPTGPRVILTLLCLLSLKEKCPYLY